MQQLKMYLLTAAALIVVAISLTLSPAISRPASAQGRGPSPSAVTITGPLPVPVSAVQSGTWNVGLTGTPSINVANLNAVDAFQTFDAVQCGAFPFPGHAADCTAFPVVTVPNGKRLVIEHITVNAPCELGAGAFLSIAVQVNAQSPQVHYLPISERPDPPCGLNGFPFVKSFPTTFYADSGTTVTLNAFGPGPVTSANFGVTFAVSGRFVAQ